MSEEIRCLNITIEANVKNVNFLDINLDLSTATYKPYMKPNDRPTYVHRSSNHPRGILENIPQVLKLEDKKKSMI